MYSLLRISFMGLALLLSSCASMTLTSSNQIQQQSKIEIVRVITPPLTRNTWSESYLRAYPNAPLAKAIYDSSDKPIGLLPPQIPDFGEVVGREILKRLPEKKWWPPMTMADTTVSTIESPHDQTNLFVQIKDYRISGLGHLFVMVNFKLVSKNNEILWEKFTGYNGLYSSEGENLDARLLKSQAEVKNEFEHAARYIVKNLLESMPN